MNRFRQSIRSTLDDVGIHSYPMFSSGTPLEVKVIFHVSNMRKDVDNLLKFVLDAMQGLVYVDDATIVHISATKIRCAIGEQKTIVQVTS